MVEDTGEFEKKHEKLNPNEIHWNKIVWSTFEKNSNLIDSVQLKCVVCSSAFRNCG